MRHLAAVLICAATLCLWGGAGSATEFTAGGFTGVARSDLKGDKPPGGSYKQITGSVVGLEGGIYIRPDIELVFQPHYIRRGAIVEYRNSQKQKTGPDVDLRLDYLELPIAFKFIAKTDVKPYALGGVSLGVLLQAEREVEGEPSEDIKNDINNVDVNAIIGVGMLFQVKGVVLFGEFRYTQGMRNVTVGGLDQLNRAYAVRLKNTGAQLLAGVLVPIGRP